MIVLRKSSATPHWHNNLFFTILFHDLIRSFQHFQAHSRSAILQILRIHFGKQPHRLSFPSHRGHRLIYLIRKFLAMLRSKIFTLSVQLKDICCLVIKRLRFLANFWFQPCCDYSIRRRSLAREECRKKIWKFLWARWTCILRLVLFAYQYLRRELSIKHFIRRAVFF